MGGNILGHVLRVERKHPNLTMPSAQKVDDAKAATFSPTGHALSHFAHTAGAGNDRTDFGIRNQHLLEPRIFVVTQVLLHKAREQLGLDEADHSAIIRQCRSTSMPDSTAVRPNV